MQRKVLLTAAVLLGLAAMCCTEVAGAFPAPPTILTGIDAGWSDVRGWDSTGHLAKGLAPWGEYQIAFSPYPTYQSGVRVAVGDVNGDGKLEIVTAPGSSAFTELEVFNGQTFERMKTLLPFRDAAWWNGAFVTTGDTNGDGRDEIIDGLDHGCCTTLHVLDGLNGNDLSGFFPYGDHNEIGARVAAGDFNGDGRDELLAVPLGSERLSVFGPNGGTAIRNFDAFGSEAVTGASIAAGNVLGDSRAEAVAAVQTTVGVQVKVIDVATGQLRQSFFTYGQESVSSLEVALGDVDGDGRADIILSATTPEGTQVKAIDANGTQLTSFYVLDPSIVPGASLAAGDLNGDGKAEIVLGGGPTTAPWPPTVNGPDQRVVVYQPDGTRVDGFTAYPGLFQGGVRVALADLDRDGHPEMVTAPGPGMEPEVGVFSQEWVNGRDRGTRLAHFLAFEPSFRGGVSVATGDLCGCRDVSIVVGSGQGRPGEVRVFDGQGKQRFAFRPFGDAYDGGVNVATGDLDANGIAEIVVGTLAGPARIRIFDGTVARGLTISPFVPDTAGVQLGVADLNGDGHAAILAGSATGAHPRVAIIDLANGVVRKSIEVASALPNGIRVAGGDLDGDGRDEIVVTPGFGGDGTVRIYDRDLIERGAFFAYDWNGAGMNVATLTHVDLPIAAFPRTMRLIAKKRASVIPARFRDAAGAGAVVRAAIAWGDGTRWNGRVITRGGGAYDVLSVKRYVRAGRYQVTVTLSDSRGRTSIARSAAIVRKRK